MIITYRYDVPINLVLSVIIELEDDTHKLLPDSKMNEIMQSICKDQFNFCLDEYDFIKDNMQENLPSNHCLGKVKLISKENI